jgi:hypothetical protein
VAVEDRQAGVACRLPMVSLHRDRMAQFRGLCVGFLFGLVGGPLQVAKHLQYSS